MLWQLASEKVIWCVYGSPKSIIKSSKFKFFYYLHDNRYYHKEFKYKIFLHSWIIINSILKIIKNQIKKKFSIIFNIDNKNKILSRYYIFIKIKNNYILIKYNKLINWRSDCFHRNYPVIIFVDAVGVANVVVVLFLQYHFVYHCCCCSKQRFITSAADYS